MYIIASYLLYTTLLVLQVETSSVTHSTSRTRNSSGTSHPVPAKRKTPPNHQSPVKPEIVQRSSPPLREKMTHNSDFPFLPQKSPPLHHMSNIFSSAYGSERGTPSSPPVPRKHVRSRSVLSIFLLSRLLPRSACHRTGIHSNEPLFTNFVYLNVLCGFIYALWALYLQLYLYMF